jgi:hypothetical protein
MFGLERHIRARPLASVAISPDGRTVAIVMFDSANRMLKFAARADPAVVAASPFGRVAAGLGRPFAALDAYQAFGTGYERADPGEPATGRYVFAYKKANQARADLPGRQRLIDEGYSMFHDARYRDRAFTLIDASADGRELVLDVALVTDMPQTVFDVIVGRSIGFAMCG